MEGSGVPQHDAVPLDDLADIVAQPGPFLSVYLPAEGDVENAAHLSELRWKSLRTELEGAGAAETALASVDPLVPDAHLHGRCLAVVTTDRGVAHLEYGPRAPVRSGGVWDLVPRLLPIVEWRQTSPPWIAVLTDRTGAEVYAFRREGPDVHREAGGDEDPIRRVKPGGWSQRRYQERAQNTWQRNARDVAEVVARLAEQVRARLIVASGDVRALQLLRESLPERWLGVLEVLEGERWEGRPLDEVREDLERPVRRAADQDTADLIGTWRAQIGREDRATEGARSTLQALARAQVQILLVHDDPQNDGSAWFGPEAIHVAGDREVLRSAGVDDPWEGRLVDVAVRAALGTGAEVRVVPAEAAPEDGVGGLLRWSD
jgi:hypothetical protein